MTMQEQAPTPVQPPLTQPQQPNTAQEHTTEVQMIMQQMAAQQAMLQQMAADQQLMWQHMSAAQQGQQPSPAASNSHNQTPSSSDDHSEQCEHHKSPTEHADHFVQMAEKFSRGEMGMEDVAGGLSFLNSQSGTFWKGLILGGGVTLLMSNDSVRSTIAGLFKRNDEAE